MYHRVETERGHMSQSALCSWFTIWPLHSTDVQARKQNTIHLCTQDILQSDYEQCSLMFKFLSGEMWNVNLGVPDLSVNIGDC